MDAVLDASVPQATSPEQYGLTPSFLDVQNFYPHASALRSEFESHFAKPYERCGEIQQIWDYWHVPDMYSYLRTNPGKIFSRDVLSDFFESLRAWSIDTLGLGNVSQPYLSMYVNGCSQGLHNDSKNGRFGYVFSLTTFESRCFVGGETILLKPEPYWNTKRIQRFAAGNDLHVLVPPLFNQLLVFDDRLIHGVRMIQGSMNPSDSRVVIHGHISESGIMIDGPLALDAVSKQIESAVSESLDDLDDADCLHGVLTLRMNVYADGNSGDIRILCNRLLPTNHSGDLASQLFEKVSRLLKRLKFPAHERGSEVTLPIVIECQ